MIAPSRKYLVVNADDFGQSSGINRGIIEAHEHGIVTSASLMVRWPAAAEAAAYSLEHPSLSVGLHLDLGEWIYQDGQWVAAYEVVPLQERTKVMHEVSLQLAVFRQLLGKDPTHIDSHQHVHMREPVFSIVADIAAQLRVPLRQCSPEVRYCGGFYGQTRKGEPWPEGIRIEALIEILMELEPGITELGCHPGQADGLDSVYGDERPQEVKALCDPRVRAVIQSEGIVLSSFTDRGCFPSEPSAVKH